MSSIPYTNEYARATAETIVVTGGTDGLGRAVVRHRLAADATVLIIGRDPAKGAALLAEAARLGTGRAHFITADLSLVGETREAIEEVRSLVTEVDALVLCARHFSSARTVTAEGFESTFALSYLSRFVACHEMSDLLEAAPAPVILNVAGPTGAAPPAIRWADPGLEHDYDGGTAMRQAGPLNDLLGVGFTLHRPSTTVRYVLFHPGVVDSGFAGEYDAADAARIAALRQTAVPVEQAVHPLLAVLDEPPTAPLSAFMTGTPISVDGPAFDVEDARRLHTATLRLLRR
ncbi:NAD(P)-dependent dehydrogenase (short-subunit alcohol dehydrogenase family) [Actinoalloteichus hoggarensis]|uniref:Oxidoreductase n=1 Tax=Actinoalloteichus hoggarensis TaxID=1470176 RepID=A0A221VZG1_9PSEU|nr:SDR family NAD(P)-dependent oxidoreductase [Actinoalloteichus hoggarensis]ASO18890.1 oxidoreductase [Actinoalloteichus hoggarensis]MBB5920125.1 NAD(P)-dependent dehydrogenase (short-subunit alcohol dehydrogenase family) [Actinoalloteichus hoggarensis]